ncbi:MAG: hypothetical protein SGILL_001577 [Bacillariaceae sp.]
MSLNYHELTMNEPRDSPARRKQFLVICSVMASVFAYTAITSGAFLPIATTDGIFPGGNFCYKFAVRDYAASNGQGRRVAEDWALATTLSEETEVVKLQGEERDDFKQRRKMMENKLYNVFLDDPYQMGGARTRYMTGVLVSDADKEEFCDPLMEYNPSVEKAIIKGKKTPEDEKNAGEMFKETLYEYVDLPSILPAMRKQVIEKGGEGTVPVVISQCDKKQEMCTHYAPLVQGSDFLVGNPTSEELAEALGPETFFLNWEHMKGGARRISPAFMKEYIDLLP